MGASLFLSLIGALILSDFDWHHLELANSKYLVGNFLVLIACASSSFYNVYCKELLRRFTALEVLIYSYLLAFVISVPLLSWAEHFSLLEVRGYKSQHLAGLNRFERAELGASDGPLDVPVEASGRQPGFRVDLPSAISGRLDLCGDTQREDNGHHDRWGPRDLAWDHPDYDHGALHRVKRP